MTRLRLIRLEYNILETLGVLLVNDKLGCFTLELPWKGNQKNVSCIPTGKYKGKRDGHHEDGIVYHIHGVPNRSGIMIHAGNTHIDIEGCILPGLYPGYLDGVRAVLSSRTAIERLDWHFKERNDDFEIEMGDGCGVVTKGGE